MQQSTFVVLALAVLQLLLVSAEARGAKFVFSFDPQYAAGISGSISAQYGSKPTGASVSVSLDFSKIDAAAIKKLDSHCSSVAEFQFHIHTKWTNSHQSASLQQCAVNSTGNHFDPKLACSAGSEFANTEWCPTKRVKSYHCAPGITKKGDHPACELGDLSGRLGAIKSSSSNKQRVSWTKYDSLFPSQADVKGKSVVLHAVCGSNTVRVACAAAVKAAH